MSNPYPTASTVKRPYMRSVPCVVLCRADGHHVVAYIGDLTSALTDGENGIAGFGMNLSEALRKLASAIEDEVTPRLRASFE